MREGLKFSDVWASLAEAIDYAVADLAAVAEFERKMLSRFNREYQLAYESRTWEDAWTDGELTPTESGRFLAWSEVEDSRHFDLWTADPREVSGASEVLASVTRAGITLNSSHSTVYAFWMPPARVFTLTAYNAGTAYAVGAMVMAANGHNYRCIQAGTGQEPSVSATYWTQVPVLDVLADDVVELAAGLHKIRTGHFEEGNARRRMAKENLSVAAAGEWARLARQQGRPWRPASG